MHHAILKIYKNIQIKIQHKNPFFFWPFMYAVYVYNTNANGADSSQDFFHQSLHCFSETVF